jgi:hypothetical protein
MKISELFTVTSQDEHGPAGTPGPSQLSLLPFFGLLAIACLLAIAS